MIYAAALPPMRGFTARLHHDKNPFCGDLYAGLKGEPIRLALGGTVKQDSRPVTIPATRAAPRVSRAAAGTIMHTLILRTRWGGLKASFGISHVLDTVTTGEVAPWQEIGHVGDSGIETLCSHCSRPCEPAHMHIFGWWGHGRMPRSGAGNISYVECLAALGIVVDEWVPKIPGPGDYHTCHWFRGKRR